ncbi:hypothetical protein MT962_003323 [Franconibacter sp. IITDAS19]|uniref:hypothetical protein n=1 Tax=Franconibacter sp. IITDAS19 TaxID=2930569 RepID=UPI001FF8769F|nr:hypothetical protein [Franconibacter sp. IITDAS19]MCK1969461.1 hypothetical protein [Franconibacter sp. IITDAS19]
MEMLSEGQFAALNQINVVFNETRPLIATLTVEYAEKTFKNRKTGQRKPPGFSLAEINYAGK